MRCHRCGGNILREDTDLFCLSCGWREEQGLPVAPSIPVEKFIKADPHALPPWFGKAVEMVEAGETKVKIIKELKISQTRLYHWLRKAGVKSQKKDRWKIKC